MTKALDRSELAAMAKAGLAQAKAHTIEKASGVMRLPAGKYYDPAVFDAEVAKIFRRVPLLLAVTAQMPDPGDFKNLDAAGVPVLISRSQDGDVRAFVNSCSHRGTAVATEQSGNAQRFVCPYHGWTFSQKEELMGVAAADDFGEATSNQANYYVWGPHQRAQAPTRDLEVFETTPEAEWPAEAMLNGVWTIFPHVSNASFEGGGRGVMISRVLPDETVGQSYTTQIYLMEKAPNEEQAKAAHDQFELLKFMVEEQDYATGLRQQVALKNGGRGHVLFGENEGGAQCFHQWVEKPIYTDDDKLEVLFAAG